MRAAPIRLDDSRFGLVSGRGFLAGDGVRRPLPPRLAAWEELVKALPELLAENRLAAAVDALPAFEIDRLGRERCERAKAIVARLTQAYVWEPVYHASAGRARSLVPRVLAEPLVELAKRLDEPPIFNYADSVLRNWRRTADGEDFSLGGLESEFTFSGRHDESQFTVVHVAYEGVADEVLGLGAAALAHCRARDGEGLGRALTRMALRIEELRRVLGQIRTVISPEVFRQHVRLFLQGWRGNAAVVYEGEQLDPSELRGETAAQSAVLPFVDSVLGLIARESTNEPRSHDASSNRQARDIYKDFGNYMPRGHRELLARMRDCDGVRRYVEGSGDKALCDAFDACVEAVLRLRAHHLGLIGPYIHGPGQAHADKAIGTGGTQYREYLSSLTRITKLSKLRRDGPQVGLSRPH